MTKQPMTAHKAWLAVAGAILSYLATVLAGPMTPSEWVNVAIAGVTAIGVYVVPRMDSQPWAKEVVAIAGASLVVLSSAITDGQITQVEIVNITLAALTAAGVAGMTDRPKGDSGSVSDSPGV